MSKGYLNNFYIIFLTMLITAINTLCSKDNNFSRRDMLFETLKIADKQARNDERLTFLCERHRSRINPKFIQSLVSRLFTGHDYTDHCVILLGRLPHIIFLTFLITVTTICQIRCGPAS